ncbi:MAG: ABC transporter permease, partial [Candidatus Thiodiazotropha taylori]
MLTYLIRRVLLMVPTLLGITLVVFVVMASSPGGISAQSLVEGQNLDPEAKQEIEAYYNRLYGLDDPPYMQYLRWLNNVSPVGFVFDEENQMSGFSFSKGADFGRSFRYGRPVTDLLAERVPITVLLNVLSIPLVYMFALLVGVRAAVERGRSFDVSSGIVMLALWSVPTMLAGVLLIGFFANQQYWHWFPTAGLSDRLVLDQV